MNLAERLKLNKGQWNSVAVAALVLLAFSFVFGGASRTNLLRVTLIELAALPLLVLTAASLIRTEAVRTHRFALILAGLLAALPLLQLMPLPPSWVLGLPGREDLSQALALAGVTPGLMSLSLTPDLTWRAFLALLAPIAILMAMIALGPLTQGRIIWTFLSFGAVSVSLCALQVTTSDPRLYSWSWTDPGLAVGFFANRNHMAALCTSTLPFAAYLAMSASRDRSTGGLFVWIGLSYVGLMVVALAAIQSRAGVMMGAVSLIASVLAALAEMGWRRPNIRVLGLASVVVVAVAAVLLWAGGPVFVAFDTADAPEGRLEYWPLIAEAAQTYLPIGSGIGSFDSVFRSVELLETLRPTYFNEAHNEYLQIWLETGWPGVALLIAFLVWFARRSWSAWTAGADTGHSLQRAASIAIGVILLHSAVDYPLRTETMMVFFALCCGILEFAGRPHGERARCEQVRAA